MESDCLIEGPIGGKILAGILADLGKETSVGGHSLFLGQVRADMVNGRIVKGIEYSAYDKMVNAEAGKIMEEIMDEFDDVESMEIIHSNGMVMAGEISLMILISAGHRRQATAACTKTLELVKERLPVWKKEIFQDGTHEWK